MENFKTFKCQKWWEKEGPISYPFQTCHEHNKTLRLFTLKGTSYRTVLYWKTSYMENSVSETKTGTEEKSICSEKLQKLRDETGMHFCRMEQSKSKQPVTDSKRRTTESPPHARQIAGLSHSAKRLRQRDSKGQVSLFQTEQSL